MSKQGQRLRIIGGSHRGRILNFEAADGLRPTPDRVRETLFNWLQPVIQGASCLDLFAGSGVLGLEAASRGAGAVVWVDANGGVAAQIKSHIELLKLTNTEVITGTAQAYLQQADQVFSIVFLDPPYHGNLLKGACELLEDRQLLASNTYIYLESETAITQDQLPASWQLRHQKRAGQVFYHLAVRG